MPPFVPPTGSGGTPSNPYSTTGPSWFTAPSSKASVGWNFQQIATGAGMRRPGEGFHGPSFYLTPKQAKAQLTGFTQSQKAILSGALAKAGVKPNGGNTMWGRVVDYVQAQGQNGNFLDPFDVLKGISDGSVPYSAGGGSGGGTSTSHSSSSSVSHQITDRGAADRLLDDVLSNYLGRTASDGEKARFLKNLNVKERATPTSTSTSSSTSVSSARTSNSTSSSSSTSRTGIDPQEEAINQAKKSKDYAEYQYGTTYMNAFLSALGAPVSAAGTV